VHRFRSQWLELSRRLRNVRARYGLTQDEVAAVVGANDGTALAQWENGTNAASAAQAPPRPMASWLRGATARSRTSSTP
jgi:transcriptional regulator with XRE-family HTH domain